MNLTKLVATLVLVVTLSAFSHVEAQVDALALVPVVAQGADTASGHERFKPNHGFKGRVHATRARSRPSLDTKS